MKHASLEITVIFNADTVKEIFFNTLQKCVEAAADTQAAVQGVVCF